MMYKRALAPLLANSKMSILLLGPRQTGKSTLIRSLHPELVINLADEREFLAYSSQEDLLYQEIQLKKPKTIFVDEIQRIPSLLNSIQSILDESSKKIKFYLTGSSARKLRRGKANLLPGRIISKHLGTLTLEELSYNFDLKEILKWGLLPGIFTEEDDSVKRDVLNTYAATYLKEEIQAEALTKNIEGFSRFLFVIAEKNGEHVDFAKLGSMASITQKTATRFFEILEDTLLIYRLNAYAKSPIRRLLQHPKYYFFDVGVLNALQGSFQVGSDRIGSVFETFIFNQLRLLAEMSGQSFNLCTFRTFANAEVDFILEMGGKIFAIEVKASANIGKSDLTGFKSFAEVEKKKHQKLVFYLGTKSQMIDDIKIFPFIDGIQYLKKQI